MDLKIVVSAACATPGGAYDPAPNSRYCSAGANFEHTFSFAQSGAVFDLPSGMTANSVDGTIVNNALVLVPEPGTGLLVMTGLLGLAAQRKWYA